MKSLTKTLLTGLLTILPVVVTLAIISWLAGALESMLGGLIRWILPDGAYITGMGLVAGLILVVVAGVVMSTWLAQQFYERFEQLLLRVPMVNGLYAAIKDMTSLFSPGRQRQFSAVVAFKLPGSEARIMGFVTRDSCADLPPPLGGPNVVAVYMPMSYQIGGYTLLLPRDQLESVDMSTPEAIRFALTAGVTSGANGAEDGDLGRSA